MRKQGVIHVRKIKDGLDNALKDTNTFVFTFNSSALPKQLKVVFLRVSVDPYIPNPLRCLGWSGGAMVLGNLPVPGRPTYFD